MVNYIKKFIVTCIGICVFLGLTEGLLRLIYQPKQLTFDGIYEYDSEKIFRLKSNITGDFEEKRIYTNSYGFQGEAFPVLKDTNEWRALFVGDSITFGHGVNFFDTFSQQYYSFLKSAVPNKKITVINAGVPGYSIMQEYFDFVRSLRFNPDVVILQFTLNDVTEPFMYQLRLGGIGMDYHQVQDMSFWHYYLSQRSALYLCSLDLIKIIKFGTTNEIVIKSRAKYYESLNDSQLVFDPDDIRQGKQWDEYFLWFKKFADVCKRENIPCYVLLSPYTFQLELDRTQDIPQEKITSFAQKNHVTVIDMLPVFRELIRLEIINKYKLSEDITYEVIINEYKTDIQHLVKKYFLDSDHYTEAGHSIVKEQLTKILHTPS